MDVKEIILNLDHIVMEIIVMLNGENWMIVYSLYSWVIIRLFFDYFLCAILFMIYSESMYYHFVYSFKIFSNFSKENLMRHAIHMTISSTSTFFCQLAKSFEWRINCKFLIKVTSLKSRKLRKSRFAHGISAILI